MRRVGINLPVLSHAYAANFPPVDVAAATFTDVVDGLLVWCSSSEGDKHAGMHHLFCAWGVFLKLRFPDRPQTCMVLPFFQFPVLVTAFMSYSLYLF